MLLLNYSSIVLFLRFLIVSFARSPHICNKDFLKLAVEDFNSCQSIHQNELKQLERCISFFTIKDLG